ncbi:MAG: biopolymer transporter ExbD [Balneolaceae bacterium]|nr:biopolymer transporter ExbD [Balneolaceae bacterium]
MIIKKNKSRDGGEIPSSSLADIAFLLLIFFLLVTTIDIDTGIGLTLPPAPDENVEPPPIKERNLLNISVNESGQVLLDEEPTAISQVKQMVKDFVTNNGQDPNLSEAPDMAIVSIKTHRQTPYRIYINMLDEVIGAYNELRNQASQEMYGRDFSFWDEGSEQYETVKNRYPKKISIAEPDEG